VSLILDSGALIALERGERAMWRRLKAAHLEGEVPLTHGGVIGQVWRKGGTRQTRLSMALAGIDVRALDLSLGRSAGELLAVAKTRDVIDAALVLLAREGDQLATSDPGDIQILAKAAGRRVAIIATDT
jgi:hypothetical protein